MIFIFLPSYFTSRDCHRKRSHPRLRARSRPRTSIAESLKKQLILKDEYETVLILDVVLLFEIISDNLEMAKSYFLMILASRCNHVKSNQPANLVNANETGNPRATNRRAQSWACSTAFGIMLFFLHGLRKMTRIHKINSTNY
jgi:hypothetical protein